MPILKQAKKALRRDKNRRAFNLRAKREMKRAMKILQDTVRAGDTKTAQEMLPTTYKAIDKATKRGIIKKNTAARYKSRMSRLLKSS